MIVLCKLGLKLILQWTSNNMMMIVIQSIAVFINSAISHTNKYGFQLKLWLWLMVVHMIDDHNITSLYYYRFVRHHFAISYCVKYYSMLFNLTVTTYTVPLHSLKYVCALNPFLFTILHLVLQCAKSFIQRNWIGASWVCSQNHNIPSWS